MLAAEGFALGLQACSRVSSHSGSIHLTKVSPDKLFSSVVWVNGGLNLLWEAQGWTDMRAVP